MTTRPRPDEHGATTAEYVMVVAVVALMIGALAVSDLARPVGDAVRAAFCTISPDRDATCATTDFDHDDYRLPDCSLASSSSGVGGSLTAFSGKLGADGTYRVVEVGDGVGDPRYEVQLDVSGSLGAELMSGGRIDADGLGIKQGRSGSVSLTGEGTMAPTFAFETEQEARDFVDATTALLTGPVDDLWDWRTLTPGGAARIAGNQIRRILGYDLPDPVRTRVEGGVTLGAEGGLYGGGAVAEGELSLGRAVGAEIDHETGETTIFHRLEAEAAAAMGLVGAGGSGGLSSDVVIGVTLGDGLEPQQLSFGWTGSASAGAAAPDLEALWFASGTPLPADVSQAAGIGLDLSSEQSWTLEATADIDLTDPRLRSSGESFLRALQQGDLDGVRDSGGELVDHVVHDSDLLVQYHAGTIDEAEVDVAGGHVLAFGLGASYTSTEDELRDAWYRQGGHAWNTEVCGV